MSGFAAWVQRITGGAPGRFYFGGSAALGILLILLAALILWQLGWPGWHRP